MVKARTKITLIVLVGSLACLMVALWWLTRHGFSARDEPATIEVWIADGYDTWLYRHHSDRLRIPFHLRPIS
jgi:hypothetical protein